MDSTYTLTTYTQRVNIGRCIVSKSHLMGVVHCRMGTLIESSGGKLG